MVANGACKDPVVWIASDPQMAEIGHWLEGHPGAAAFDAVIVADALNFLSGKSEKNKGLYVAIDRMDVAVGLFDPAAGAKHIRRLKEIWRAVVPVGTENRTDPNRLVMFEVHEEHIKLFTRLNMRPSFGIDGSGHLEIRPAIDWKRPFGNSGVVYDACQILGYVDGSGEVTDGLVTKAMLYMAQLPVAAECFAASGKIEPGTYMVSRSGAWFHYKNIAMAIFWREAIDVCSAAGLDAEKAAEFAANTPARHGNPYALLSDMETFFSGTAENRRILKIFEDYAVMRYEAVHGNPNHDRSTVLAMLKAGTAGMSWPGWPFNR